MKVSFTVGIFAERDGAEQTWTALVPAAHAINISGANETRLRETIVDRLRAELRKAPPHLHERFHLHAGTRLERVSIDVSTRPDAGGRRISGTFPLVCVPRWLDGEQQRLICFHPSLPDRWFAAADIAEVAELAPHFARVGWADVDASDLDDMKATGKERLTTVTFSAEPKSLLDELRDKPGKQRAGASRGFEQILGKLGVDLTALAVNGTLAMGVPREPYRAQLARLLCGARLRSTVLIGPPGVGKRTLLHRWIGDRLDDDGFTLHRNLDRIHRVWRLSGKRIIAGMSYLGDWEKRCLAVAEEARRTKAILWLDDLHLFGRIGQSRQSDRSLADFFRGPMQRGELTVVAALTAEQLARLEDDAPAMASLLVRLPVHPASTTQTLELLLTEIRELEQKLPVDVHPFVPRTAIELGSAIFPWTSLPGTAIDLVRKVADACAPIAAPSNARAVAALAARGGSAVARAAVAGRAQIGPADVVRHLARATGLAEALLTLETPLDPASVEAAFARRVMGQPAAIGAASDIVMKVRAGLADPGRPLGVYLFTGPTGTGKTELATALAEYLYGDVARLVRLDMSEFGGPDAPARLIGDRHAPEGLLTQRIREQPFSVVLLDEIEKAHPSVLALLLQLFDEGRLTDAAGNAASFAHAVVVMTSNLGARRSAPVGFGDHDAAILVEVARAVREFFPPELWNRIDRVVPFAPLSAVTAARIVDKELQRLLARRGLRERSVFVYAGAAVKARAVAEAFDPRYGARTVKRWLEDRVAGLLADELAAGGTARMRVIRLVEAAPAGAGEPATLALHVEPMTEAACVPGRLALEPLLELAVQSLLPHAAATAHALHRALEDAPLRAAVAAARDAGEAYVADRVVDRMRHLAAALGGQGATRASLDRDDALAALAEANLLHRHLDEMARPAAHVVTLSLVGVGHGAGPSAGPSGVGAPVDLDAPGSVARLARAYAGAGYLGDLGGWFDVGAARRADGSIVAFAAEPGRGEVSWADALRAPCTHVVLVLRDVLLAPALAGEHGSHVFQSLAGEPEIVRVEVTAGARDPRAAVVEHQRALQAFEAAVDRGGALPLNPESLLPVVRRLGYRPPLRAGEPWQVEVEDFVTGWSAALDLRGPAVALELARWLRWSATADEPAAPRAPVDAPDPAPGGAP